MLVKLVLISDTYCILMIAIPLLLRQKMEQTDPGAPPWTMDRVDSELAKRLSGNLTKDHVTAHTCHKFLSYKRNLGEGG